jgi:hypothetical protein
MHNLVITQLYHIKALKTRTCFDPCGIVIRAYLNHTILYKTLNN